MSNILDLLRKRRSVRRFTERPVEQEKINLLMEAVVRSPSSKGRNPWDFIFVVESQQKKRLAEAKPRGGNFVAEAPLAVVVCADPEKCDVWVEDCSIAAIILQLTAQQLGLGSCWSQIRQRNHENGRRSSDYLRAVLDLPEGYEVEAVVGIGYPAEQKAGHDRQGLPWNRIHQERFNPS